jgi:hypothetical protein
MTTLTANAEDRNNEAASRSLLKGRVEGAAKIFRLWYLLSIAPVFWMMLESLEGKFGQGDDLAYGWIVFSATFAPMFLILFFSQFLISESKASDQSRANVAIIWIFVHFLMMMVSMMYPVSVTPIQMLESSLSWLLTTQVISALAFANFAWSK